MKNDFVHVAGNMSLAIISLISGDFVTKIIEKAAEKIVTSTFGIVKKGIQHRLKKYTFKKSLSKAIKSGDPTSFIKQYKNILSKDQIKKIKQLAKLQRDADLATKVVNHSMYDKSGIQQLIQFRDTLKDTILLFSSDRDIKLKITDKETKESTELIGLNNILALLSKLIGSAYTHKAMRLTPDFRGVTLDYSIVMKSFSYKMPIVSYELIEKGNNLIANIDELSFELERAITFDEFKSFYKKLLSAYDLGKRIFSNYNTAVKYFKQALLYIKDSAIKPKYSKLSEPYLKAIIDIFSCEAEFWTIKLISDVLKETDYNIDLFLSNRDTYAKKLKLNDPELYKKIEATLPEIYKSMANYKKMIMKLEYVINLCQSFKMIVLKIMKNEFLLRKKILHLECTEFDQIVSQRTFDLS